MAAVLAGTLIVHNEPREEPQAEGKLLSAWLSGCPLGSSRRSPNDDYRNQSLNAVRAIGTNALPYLLRMATREESVLRRRAEQLVDALSFGAYGIGSEPEYKYMAEFGYEALGEIGKPHVPIYRSWVLGGDLERSVQAARILAAMGPAAESAIPDLLEARRRHPNIRWAYDRTLGMIHSQPEITIPALMEFEGKATNYSGTTLFALGCFGSNAVAALPVIRRMASESGNKGRGEAAKALAEIDPEGSWELAVPVLAEEIASGNETFERMKRCHRLLFERHREFAIGVLQEIVDSGRYDLGCASRAIEVLQREAVPVQTEPSVRAVRL